MIGSIFVTTIVVGDFTIVFWRATDCVGGKDHLRG